MANDYDYKEVENLTIFCDSSLAIKQNNRFDDVIIPITTGVMECAENERIDVELVEFVCKRDFYNLQTYNSSFSIYYSAADHNYTLTQGFISINSVDDELKADFQAAFPTATWTVSYNNYLGKITIAGTLASGTFPADLALNLNVENSCYNIIGFSKASHAFTGAGTNSVSLTSDLVINVQGEESIYLRTDMVYKNKQSGPTNVVNSDILAKMNILVGPLNNISYYTSALGMFRTKTKLKNLCNFRIRLTNETNDLIGLNSNFQCTFKFYKMKIAEVESNEYLKEIRDLERMKVLKKNII